MELLLSSATLVKLVSFLFWSALYLWYQVASPTHSPEYCSRAVTLLHGSIATIAGLSQCGLTALTECSFTTKMLPQHYALMVWSWGYFAFDLLWCLMYWPSNGLMLCHHATALGAITVYMGKEYSGCAFPCALAFMEITNPLLQTRWFLRNKGYDKTIIFVMVEVMYLLMFLVIRGVLGTYVVYKIMKTDIFAMDEKIISLIFYAVSIAFILEMVGYVLYKYKTKIVEFEGFLEEMGIILNDQT